MVLSQLFIYFAVVSVGNISLHFQTFILPLIVGVSKLFVALSIKNALSILKSELSFFFLCMWRVRERQTRKGLHSTEYALWDTWALIDSASTRYYFRLLL